MIICELLNKDAPFGEICPVAQNLDKHKCYEECGFLKKEMIESGTTCKKCNIGKIALMAAIVGEADLDNEPYKEGVKEGSNISIQLQNYITLSILACDSCGYIFTVNIESPQR